MIIINIVKPSSLAEPVAMSTLVLPAVTRPITATTANKPRLQSQELFRHSSELIIEHRGEEYRLKLTRNDKLILNK